MKNLCLLEPLLNNNNGNNSENTKVAERMLQIHREAQDGPAALPGGDPEAGAGGADQGAAEVPRHPRPLAYRR